MRQYITRDDLDQVAEEMKEKWGVTLGWTAGHTGWDWHEYAMKHANIAFLDLLNAIIEEQVQDEYMTDDERQLLWEEEAQKVVDGELEAEFQMDLLTEGQANA